MWIKRWNRFLNWQDGRVANKMDVRRREYFTETEKQKKINKKTEKKNKKTEKVEMAGWEDYKQDGCATL